MLRTNAGRSTSTVGAAVRSTSAIGGLVLLELLALGSTRGAWRVVRAPGPASLDEAVLLAVLAGCALLGGWVVLGVTLGVVAHLPGQLGAVARRGSRTLAPAATRRLAAVLVGATLGSSFAPAAAGSAAGGAPEPVPGFAVTRVAPSPATQAPGSSPIPSPSPSDPDAQHHTVVPGWTPSRPAHTSTPITRLVASGSTSLAGEVVVHRGDSLWSIARRQLGPGATDAEVAAAWPHWYAANRAVIGPDPGHLLPGQVLVPPAGAHP